MRAVLMILTILLPLVLALLLWLVKPLQREKPRAAFVIGSLAASLLLCVLTACQGDGDVILFTLFGSLPVLLRSDALGRVFSLLCQAMWLLCAVFSVPYMKKEAAPARFYTFYLLTLSAIMGCCYAGTLVTLYLFFEMTTLLSVGLVLHEMTKEAVAAGIKYLLYSIAGAMLGLFGVFVLARSGGGGAFVPGGMLAPDAAGNGLLLAGVFVSVVGFGTKAGLFPMHGWLPTAHPAAPAPASAVLSGVITKMGVLCILRIIYYVVGAELLRGTWVQTAAILLSLVTIFMGSMLALGEDLLKKRLAWSSVSQVSYILLGVFLLDETALEGALLHVIAHSLMKDGLFLCAGAMIYKTGLTRVSELRGVGKEMPVTLAGFTLLSLGLIGVPPALGFISKWFLATGALESGISILSWLSPVVLLISALLTAGYLLPVTIGGYFPADGLQRARNEAPASMLVPILILAVVSVLLGVFPAGLQALIARVCASVL